MSGACEVDAAEAGGIADVAGAVRAEGLLSHAPGPAPMMTTVKIIVSGGFGVGKTTLVGTISDIEPLVTEAPMTEAAREVDDTEAVTGLTGKSSTTVALDFGRIALDESLLLYLFGTPGQERFSFLWDDLVEGALGAIVLVDTSRIEDCYPVVDYFEEHDIPFLLGVNVFDPRTRFEHEEIREALGVGPEVAIVDCDARRRDSVKEMLLALIHHVLMERLQLV